MGALYECLWPVQPLLLPSSIHEIACFPAQGLCLTGHVPAHTWLLALSGAAIGHPAHARIILHAWSMSETMRMISPQCEGCMLRHINDDGCTVCVPAGLLSRQLEASGFQNPAGAMYRRVLALMCCRPAEQHKHQHGCAHPRACGCKCAWHFWQQLSHNSLHCAL